LGTVHGYCREAVQLTRMPAKILVAAFPGARGRVGAILHGYAVSFADTLSEAIRLCKQQRFDLILVGTRFDESRMFDLLRYLHVHEEPMRRTPLVCFRGMMRVPATDAAIVEGLSLSCGVLGALAFYDFAGYADDAVDNARVRAIFESHLGGV
jgi:CheY-like chemotaxis protein